MNLIKLLHKNKIKHQKVKFGVNDKKRKKWHDLTCLDFRNLNSY